MSEALAASFPARQSDSRVLFASEPDDQFDALQKDLWINGCEVVPVGLGEALWLWPMAGYDLVLIKVKEDPESGIALCRHIKGDCPAQKVALLFGDHDGIVPDHFEADAVVSGAPSAAELMVVVRLLLASPASGLPSDSPRKPVRRSEGRHATPEMGP